MARSCQSLAFAVEQCSKVESYRRSTCQAVLVTRPCLAQPWVTGAEAVEQAAERCAYGPGLTAFAPLHRRDARLCHLFCTHIAPRPVCSSNTGHSYSQWRRQKTQSLQMKRNHSLWRDCCHHGRSVIRYLLNVDLKFFLVFFWFCLEKKRRLTLGKLTRLPKRLNVS